MAKADKAEATKSDATKILSEIGLQNFTMQRMHRAEIKRAPYNPRIISEAAKRKLRAGLKKHGLVAPLTFNKRTGNLVGGHQRIGQLDALAGTSDYELDVAVIDVDEKKEKELNILLNNQSAAGDWDVDALGEMLKSGLDIEGTGFDSGDVYRLFGEGLIENGDPLDELVVKVTEARDAFNAIAREDGSHEEGESEFYLIVVFRDGQQLTKFLKKHELPDNRYQSGEDIMRLTGDL